MPLIEQDNSFLNATIMMVDDEPINNAIVQIFMEEEGYHKFVTADDSTLAMSRLEEARPDLLLLDLMMPEVSGFEILAQVRSHPKFKHLPVIILTMHEEEQYVVRAIEAGAMGYITKKSAPEQLVNAIEKVFSGKRYLTDEISELLALRVARGTGTKSPLDSLSTRELQVLKRLAQGHTNREIAEAYNISIKTVDTYRFRLLKKLNLRNNADISRFAIQNRLIEP